MPSILTFSGKTVDLENPTVDMIDIADIAHALAQLNRFTGHTDVPYTVAEHCMAGSQFVPAEDRLEFLLHDAQEAYLGDVSSPLKSLLGNYRELEAHFERVIQEKFLLRKPSAAVKTVDKQMCRAEQHVFMTNGSVAEDAGIALVLMSKYLMERPRRTPSENAGQFELMFYKLVAERHYERVSP